MVLRIPEAMRAPNAFEMLLPRWKSAMRVPSSLRLYHLVICSIFVLPDFPATTRWLSDAERKLAMRRMEEDIGVGDEEETEVGGNATVLTLAFKDSKAWWLAAAATTQSVTQSFSAYFPTLSETLGFDPVVTLLLCAPPFIAATVTAFITSM